MIKKEYVSHVEINASPAEITKAALLAKPDAWLKEDVLRWTDVWPSMPGIIQHIALDAMRLSIFILMDRPANATTAIPLQLTSVST